MRGSSVVLKVSVYEAYANDSRYITLLKSPDIPALKGCLDFGQLEHNTIDYNYVKLLTSCIIERLEWCTAPFVDVVNPSLKQES